MFLSNDYLLLVVLTMFFGSCVPKNIVKIIALCRYHLFFLSSLEVLGRMKATLNIKDLMNEPIC